MPAKRQPALTLDQIKQYYRLPLVEAADRLRVSVSMLKRLCRHYGIKRWPYRTLQSLDKSASTYHARIENTRDLLQAEDGMAPQPPTQQSGYSSTLTPLGQYYDDHPTTTTTSTSALPGFSFTMDSSLDPAYTRQELLMPMDRAPMDYMYDRPSYHSGYDNSGGNSGGVGSAHASPRLAPQQRYHIQDPCTPPRMPPPPSPPHHSVNRETLISREQHQAALQQSLQGLQSSQQPLLQQPQSQIQQQQQQQQQAPRTSRPPIMPMVRWSSAPSLLTSTTSGTIVRSMPPLHPSQQQQQQQQSSYGSRSDLQQFSLSGSSATHAQTPVARYDEPQDAVMASMIQKFWTFGTRFSSTPVTTTTTSSSLL